MKLTLYTLVFVGTWIFPVFLRLRLTFTDTAPESFLVWFHHIGIASVGVGNALVWGFSKSLRQTKKSKDKQTSETDTKDQINLSNTDYTGNNTGNIIQNEQGIHLWSVFFRKRKK